VALEIVEGRKYAAFPCNTESSVMLVFLVRILLGPTLSVLGQMTWQPFFFFESMAAGVEEKETEEHMFMITVCLKKDAILGLA
jgi:hypothetical protein